MIKISKRKIRKFEKTTGYKMTERVPLAFKKGETSELRIFSSHFNHYENIMGKIYKQSPLELIKPLSKLLKGLK